MILRNEDRAFGVPPISNIYTTEGVSLQPILGSGSIIVLGGANDCDASASLSVGSASAESGEVTVELFGGSVCEVAGFSLAIGHDSSRVEFVRATPGPFLTAHAGSELLFAVEERNSAGFISLLSVFDSSVPFNVPPVSIPEHTVLATLTYRILPGAAPGVVILRNEDRGFGFPPVDHLYSSEQGDIRPALVSGAITVGDETDESRFLRGDCNSDNVLDIADAIANLLSLFGSGKPICPEACDTNNDQLLDISDPVSLLNFLFGDSRPFEPPFPVCGKDPDEENSLGCGTSNCP